MAGVAKFIVAARAEQEIGEKLHVVGGSSRRLAESSRIVVRAVLRSEVVDLGVDGLILVARLEAVLADDLRVVDLGVQHVRILILRIAVLDAERGVAVDGLAVDTAGESRIARDVRDVELLLHAFGSEEDGEFAAVGARVSNTELQHRGRRYGEVRSDRDLLVVDADVAIGIAAGRSGDIRRNKLVQLAMAVSGEDVQPRSEIVVVADIAFVAVVGGGGLRLEIIGQAREVRRGQTGEHFSREPRDLRLRNHAIGVHFTGVGIADRHAEDSRAAAPVSAVWKMRAASGAAETFVIDEEECLVFDDRTAERGAELILNQDGFLIVDGLEKAGRIQLRVAEIFPHRSVECVGAAAYATR